MLRWLWFLLAFGSFAGAAVLAVAGQMVPVVIVLASLGLFFIAIAAEGKKALPSGVGFLVLVICLFGIWYVAYRQSNWPEAKKMLDGLADKPGEVVLVYLGLIAVAVLLIITPPILAARWIGKLISRRATPQPAPQVQPTPAVRQPRRKKELPDVGQP